MSELITPGDSSEVRKLDGEKEGLRVVEATRLARNLLETRGDFKPYNAWMGIGVSKRTYTDEMVLGYAEWGASHSNHFLIIIADDLGVYNRIPFSRKGWNEVNEKEKFRKEGLKRKAELVNLFQENDLSNVEVLTWSEAVAKLASGERGDQALYLEQLLDHQRQHKHQLHQDMIGIVEQQVPGIIEKMRREGKGGEDQVFGKFVLSLYVQDEIWMTMALSQFGEYPIKVGHKGEKL